MGWTIQTSAEPGQDCSCIDDDDSVQYSRKTTTNSLEGNHRWMLLELCQTLFERCLADDHDPFQSSTVLVNPRTRSTFSARRTSVSNWMSSSKRTKRPSWPLSSPLIGSIHCPRKSKPGSGWMIDWAGRVLRFSSELLEGEPRPVI